MMGKARYVAAAACAALLAAGAGACGTSVSVVTEGAAQGPTIAIGVAADQPGLGYLHGGEYSGFDIDVAKYVAKTLGYAEKQIVFKQLSPAMRASALTDGTVDVRSALADLSSSTGLLDAALQAIDGNAQVADAGRLVSSALGAALDPQPGPDCLMNPVCSRARADIADLDAISNGAVSRALLQAQRLSAVPQVTVEKVRAAEPAIRNALATLQKMVSNLPGGSPTQARTQLAELVRGADQLSAGMTRLAVGLDQVKGGVDQVVTMSGRLTDGLGQATDYLTTLSTHTGDGPASAARWRRISPPRPTIV